jgi:hypothetical protein
LEKIWLNSKQLLTSMMFRSEVLMVSTQKLMTSFLIFLTREGSDVLKKTLYKTCTTESKL